MSDAAGRGLTTGRLAHPLFLGLMSAFATATALAAQEVPSTTLAVRSGNHASFARLVIVYPDQRRWTLLPTENGYALTVERSDGFDLSGVFDLIPRDRIADLAVNTAGALQVDVACECYPDVIELSGRGLVLDIRDGPAPEGNPFAILRPEDTTDVGQDAAETLSSLVGSGASAPGQTAARLSERLAVDPVRLAFDRLQTDMTGSSDRWSSDLLARGIPDPTSASATSTVVPVTESAPSVPTLSPELSFPVPLPAGAAVAPTLDVPVPDATPGPATAAVSAPLPAQDAAPSASVPGPDVREVADSAASLIDVVVDPAEPEAGAALSTGKSEAPSRSDAASQLPVPAAPRRDEAPVQPPAITSDDLLALRPGRWLSPPLAPVATGVLPIETPPEPEPAASRVTMSSPQTRAVVTNLDRERLLGDFLPLRLPELEPALDRRDAQFAAEFADILARQVGRGIAQGVVEAADVAPSANSASASPPPDEAAAGTTPSTSADLPVPDPTPRTPLDQIEVRTAVDRALSGARDPEADGGVNPACLSEDLVDPALWIATDEERPDFAASRSAIIGEFDRVDPEALEAAVRYHIAHGFGAEARQLLGSFGDPSPLPAERSEVLRAMSHIVDGEAGPQTATLAGQVACPTRTALWGALASPGLPPDADYVPEAIIRGFEALPQSLRRSLGPALASRFLDIGDMETVAALRRSIDRIGLPQDTATELAREPGTLLDARVAAIEGRPDGSEARLAEVARLDGPLAPTAIVELIESQLGRGVVPDDTLIEAAAAHATEQRGTPLGARLRQAEILALIARDDFERAFFELERGVAGGELTPELVEEVSGAYLTAATARVSDRAFLARAPREVPRLMTLGAPPTPRLEAATRLLALGLPELALPLIDDQTTDPAARVLSARGWLRLGQPGTALARVAGLEGEDAQRIRAEAYGALGDMAASASVLDAIGDADGAAAAAWRAGDLARVAEDPEATRARIAAVAISGVPAAPAAPTSLAEHRDLIADIARRREAVAAELAATR